MSTSRTKMGIMYKWQIVAGYKRRFFENYYSYSVHLDCHERPHVQVSRLSNPRGPLSSPKNYEYEYDSHLRKTLTTTRHHSGSLHTYSAPPIVHLGTLQQVGSYSALTHAVLRSPYHPQPALMYVSPPVLLGRALPEPSEQRRRPRDG